MSTTVAVAPVEVEQEAARPQPRWLREWPRLPKLHSMMWLCMVLACIGASWFSYQCFLVPQPARYAPDWQDAAWVQASDGIAPVAYFRYNTYLNTDPDEAFVTIAASQVFALYINGNFAGSNARDFVQGGTSQASMYDVTSWLKRGNNVIAVRVANIDQQTPALRANLGVVVGRSVFYHGTGNGWQGTIQSAAVYPRYIKKSSSWTGINFDANSWLPIQKIAKVPTSPMLSVNPLIYEQPLPIGWMSAGAGRHAYFVRQVSLPLGFNAAWLRIAATGTATIFVNGNLAVVWSGQTSSIGVTRINYLSSSETHAHYRPGLALGTYNISPYLHPGVNTVAIYVTSPGAMAAQLGLGNLSAAIGVDLLANDAFGHTTLFTAVNDWHASHSYINGWAQGSAAALAWAPPTEVGHPGSVRTFYRTDSATLLAPDGSQRGVELVPFSLMSEVVLGSMAMVLLPWLFISLVVMRRFFATGRDALETLSLAYVPAVACVALLVALAREPQIPQPFPYTWSWGLVLLTVVVDAYILLCHNEVRSHRQRLSIGFDRSIEEHRGLLNTHQTDLWGMNKSSKTSMQNTHLRHKVLALLRTHWPVVLIFLVAIPLISYNLAYEPYWQDEMSSYYAAKNVLAHGLPFFPSGFLYTKAELHSYMLALWMLIFGDAAGTPRALSAIEYLISIPLLYGIGCYFFERRVALLATAMLALSPVSLVWGRQVRMYEQAQVLLLVVVYLFFKAVQERKRVRPVYLAMGSLVLTYLSHEETFIILPALVICVLMMSMERWYSKRRLPAILYEKHWWYAAAIGAAVIGLQLLTAHVTHPPTLGTDQSQRPFIQLTTDNIPFYMNMLFSPTKSGGSIVLNSILATVGCWWAWRSSDPRVKYCAVFLIISFLTLVLVFTMQADRYFYPLLPIYYLMSAYAMLIILQALWNFACLHIILWPKQKTIVVSGEYSSRFMRAMVNCTVAMLYACVLIAPILPISGYNLFISRLVGFSYHRHYPDYDAVGQYMHQHWHKGDVVLCVSPDFTVYYYVGHADAFFSMDRALFLLERNGQIVDTSIGAQAILNHNDLQAILDQHKRVWIISDNGLYQSLVRKRFTFPPDVHIVFEGYGSAVYLRDG